MSFKTFSLNFKCSKNGFACTHLHKFITRVDSQNHRPTQNPGLPHPPQPPCCWPSGVRPSPTIHAGVMRVSSRPPWDNQAPAVGTFETGFSHAARLWESSMCRYQQFFPSCCWEIVYRVDVKQLADPITCWGILGWFQFGVIINRAVNSHAQVS